MIPYYLISRERYEAEKASPRRTYADDHDYESWVHWMRVHVLGDGDCPPRKYPDMTELFERMKERRASIFRS